MNAHYKPLLTEYCYKSIDGITLETWYELTVKYHSKQHKGYRLISTKDFTKIITTCTFHRWNVLTIPYKNVKIENPSNLK